MKVHLSCVLAVRLIEGSASLNVTFLLCRYGEALFMNSKLISGVTEFLNTESELNEVSYEAEMNITHSSL